MDNHGSTDQSANGHASSGQLWRANQLGILELRRKPGEPIPRSVMKELLHDLAAEGIWQPQPRKPRPKWARS